MVWPHPGYLLGIIPGAWLGFVGRVLVCHGQKCAREYTICLISVRDCDSVTGNNFLVGIWLIKTVTLKSEISGNGMK